VRVRLAEPYRTLLGHLRHETGHWYWEVLVDRPGNTEAFRALFGDETVSYADAIEQHYGGAPPEGWEDAYVSSYATIHAWEDCAEAVNRSMGAQDLYPFVLAPKVLEKLRYVHDLVTAHIPYRTPSTVPS
jgi:hypothetical protein